MKTKVVGLVMIIVILKFLLPDVYSGVQNTLLAFFGAAQTVLNTSRSSMTAGWNLPIPQ